MGSEVPPDPTSARGSRAVRWWIGFGLLVLVLAPRLWFAVRPWGLSQDSVSYLDLAVTIAEGRFFDGWSLRMLHPGYPALVAALSFVVPDFEWAARWVSIAGSLGLVLPAWWWWRGASDRRWEAEVVAVFLALQAGLVIFGQDVFVESVWVALLGWTFVLSERAGGWRAGAATGLAFGAAVVVKTTAIHFLPGLVLAKLCMDARRTGLRGVLAWGTGFAVPVALLVGPVAWHAWASAAAFDSISASRESNAQRLATGELWSGIPGVAPLAADDSGEVSRGALWWFYVRALFTAYLPKLLFPWWLVVPLGGVGAAVLARRSGPTGRAWRLASAAVAVQWLVLTTEKVELRYLLPGTLVFVPACAVGAMWLATWSAEAAGRGVARPRSLVRVSGLVVGSLVLAAWCYGVVATGRANAAKENPYRASARVLSEVADPPSTVVCVNREFAWRLGVPRRWTQGDSPAAVAADVGPDEWLVVGGAEVGALPALAPLRDPDFDSASLGLRVRRRDGGIVVLSR